MNPKRNIFNLFLAIGFLLVILAQPLHQLQHLSHEKASHENFDHNSGQISEDNTCTICHFSLTPVYGSSVTEIEIPSEFSYDYLIQNSELKEVYFSFVFIYKSLRAPPYYA